MYVISVYVIASVVVLEARPWPQRHSRVFFLSLALAKQILTLARHKDFVLVLDEIKAKSNKISFSIDSQFAKEHLHIKYVLVGCYSIVFFCHSFYFKIVLHCERPRSLALNFLGSRWPRVAMSWSWPCSLENNTGYRNDIAPNK
jgi:hypothetical protein